MSACSHQLDSLSRTCWPCWPWVWEQRLRGLLPNWTIKSSKTWGFRSLLSLSHRRESCSEKENWYCAMLQRCSFASHPSSASMCRLPGTLIQAHRNIVNRRARPPEYDTRRVFICPVQHLMTRSLQPSPSHLLAPSDYSRISSRSIRFDSSRFRWHRIAFEELERLALSLQMELCACSPNIVSS